MAEEARIPTRQEMLGHYQDMFDTAKQHKKPQLETAKLMRWLCLNDLYYLLSEILSCAPIFKIETLNQDWLHDRVREVEMRPNNCLDIWFREAGKSTVITFGLTIQDVLTDPEITVGIFSFNRPIAKGFLKQIKREFEENEILRSLFPDRIWKKPEQQSPKWSEDDGLILKRKGNPKESTIEAWGLIESMPTSRHFNIRVYDDMITERDVTNEDMIKSATKAWELSLNLGSATPVKRYNRANIARYIGTRYAMNDPYSEIIKRKAAFPRVYPGTVDGTEEGDPVFWPKSLLKQKRRDMGPHTFAAQILCNPAADKVQGFDEKWLRRWHPKNYSQMNLYILVDPANAKGKKNDYTTMAVIALADDQNYRVIEGIRSRLNLTERTKELIRIHRKYGPRLIKGVGYEMYGMQADIQHIEFVMKQENYVFTITPLGGNIPKLERIRRLIPIMENGRWFLMEREDGFFIDGDKQQQSFADQFINEMSEFPVSAHDDILDMAARILEPDLKATFPVVGEQQQTGGEQTHTERSDQLFWQDQEGQHQIMPQSFYEVLWSNQ